jgi:hypothetical protein
MKRPTGKKWRSRKWLRKRSKRNGHKMGKWRVDLDFMHGGYWVSKCLRKHCEKKVYVWLDPTATALSPAAQKRCKK